MCILMGKRLPVSFNIFFSISKFLGLKMQKSTCFIEKMVLRVVFFINFRWLQTGLSELKNTKQFAFLLMVDLLRIFKDF